MSFSIKKDKHIIVNYHYVEDPREDRKGIHACSPKEFDTQVSFLSSHYRFGSIADVFDAARAKSDERVCALTFDDGLKDQYENAVPILKKHKAPATFFIITGTLDGFIPATHIVHTLLSHFTGMELLRNTRVFMKEQHSDLESAYTIPTDRRLTNERAYFDDIPTANFKETITRLPSAIKTELLDWLFERKGISAKETADTLFLNEQEIRTLYSDGFCIGSHTHQHEALDTLEKDAIRNTLQASKKRLEQITGISPTVFCYPHGGSSMEAREVLKDEGFTHAVTVLERALNVSDEALMIPRYDMVRVRAFINESKTI